MNRRICAVFCAALFLGGAIFWGRAAAEPADGQASTIRGAAGSSGLAVVHPQRGLHAPRGLPRLFDPDGDDDDATPISDLSVWQSDDDRMLFVAAGSAPTAPVALAAVGSFWLSGHARSSAALCHGDGNFLPAASLESLSVRLQI